jgi:glycerate dehydrogenase
VRKRLLVSGIHPKKEFEALNEYAETYWLDELDEKGLEALLPSIDCMLVNLWPKALGPEMLLKMSRLSFVQSGLAGVNQIPFRDLGEGVVVSSNAGGYSNEVGEYAWGILLAAAKKIVKYDRAIRGDGFVRPPTAQLGNEVVNLKGKTLGIIGYGGIGRSVAGFGKAFRMKVLAFTRREIDEEGVTTFRGASGMTRMLPQCDFLVLALPLTKSTSRMLGREELRMMKRDAILVNVARADIVDEQAMYQQLVENRDFIFATDVWWSKDGHESYSPELPFLELDNFIGTPHASGPSALVGGGPLRHALENVELFLKGERPKNVVRRDEYV